MTVNHKRQLFLTLCFFSLAVCMNAYSQVSRSPLRVLYVGGTGDIFDQIKRSQEEKNADVQSRMAAFEGMLKKYFDKVTTIPVNDYKPDMSAGYDVTVMDAVPGSKPGMLAERVNFFLKISRSLSFSLVKSPSI